jgi:hypothetical protein
VVDKECAFVLGAQDPEMREMQRALAASSYPVLYAAHHGRRCSPQTAYQASEVLQARADARPHPGILLPKAPAVFVECTLAGREPAMRIDHHHPGDPGYGCPPSEYLQGSSLGQLLKLLERDPSETQRLLAAGDHCLSAAYRGECPGVDPHELLFLRASWRAKASSRTLGDVMEGIFDAVKRVRRCYDSELDESRFLDPTEIPPDLPEAAAYEGVPVRYRDLLPRGVLKEMYKGGAPDAVERFMQEHRERGRSVYGNPYRGYAGAYWAP